MDLFFDQNRTSRLGLQTQPGGLTLTILAVLGLKKKKVDLDSKIINTQEHFQY